MALADCASYYAAAFPTERGSKYSKAILETDQFYEVINGVWKSQYLTFVATLQVS
jgi:hypothetical protein